MEFSMDSKFKEELEAALADLKENGPKPGDVIAMVVGVGTVVIKSRTLPSGLILEPAQSMVDNYFRR